MAFSGSFRIDTKPKGSPQEIKEAETDTSTRKFPKFKRTLKTLYKNFRKVFPNSDPSLKVLTHKKSDAPLVVLFSQVVQSAGGKGSYKTQIQLRRTNPSEPWSLTNKCEVKCNCPAFRYYVAHPDLRSKNMFGKPSGWNKVQNKVKNVRLIPGVCKHLISATNELIKRKEIKIK